MGTVVNMSVAFSIVNFDAIEVYEEMQKPAEDSTVFTGYIDWNLLTSTDGLQKALGSFGAAAKVKQREFREIDAPPPES